MTVSEAVIAFLDEASKESDFDFNLKMDWLEKKVSDVIQDWAEENGYDYDDATCMWFKKGDRP